MTTSSRSWYDVQQEINLIQAHLSEATDEKFSDSLEKLVKLQAERDRLTAQAKRTGPNAAHRAVSAGRSRVSASINMPVVNTSIFNLLDPAEHPLVIIQVMPRRADGNGGDLVRVRSWIEGYSDEQVDIVERGEAGVVIRQSPILRLNSIRHLTELTAATLRSDIDDPHGEILDQQTHRIWMLARNSAHLIYRSPLSGRVWDLTRYLGAYVTPNEPSIMSYLKTVAGYRDGRIVGYQEGPGGVMSQLEAIYSALAGEGIAYVHSATDFVPYAWSTHQRVRLPRESLASRQANCLDGTLLFSSLLEAMSLSPAIVIVPGRALVGCEMENGNGSWVFVETAGVATGMRFDQAVSYATSISKRYNMQAEATGDQSWFRIIPLQKIRTVHHIWPME